ncbi:hypothetical protein A2U01_0034349, partial [Trifolium medium]|nr:hypothetical protein [Trifolium medium]
MDPICASLFSMQLIRSYLSSFVAIFDFDTSSSNARKTPSGRCFPLEEAMFDMIFVASCILPRTRFSGKDKGAKANTAAAETGEEAEEDV